MYKNPDGTYTLDMFDPAFNGEADRRYAQKIRKEIDKIRDRELKAYLKAQEAKRKEKEFWDKHPNDGWLFK